MPGFVTSETRAAVFWPEGDGGLTLRVENAPLARRRSDFVNPAVKIAGSIIAARMHRHWRSQCRLLKCWRNAAPLRQHFKSASQRIRMICSIAELIDKRFDMSTNAKEGNTNTLIATSFAHDRGCSSAKR